MISMGNFLKCMEIRGDKTKKQAADWIYKAFEVQPEHLLWAPANVGCLYC